MSPLSVFTGSRVLCAMVSWILEIPGVDTHTRTRSPVLLAPSPTPQRASRRRLPPTRLALASAPRAPPTRLPRRQRPIRQVAVERLPAVRITHLRKDDPSARVMFAGRVPGSRAEVIPSTMTVIPTRSDIHHHSALCTKHPNDSPPRGAIVVPNGFASVSSRHGSALPVYDSLADDNPEAVRCFSTLPLNSNLDIDFHSPTTYMSVLNIQGLDDVLRMPNFEPLSRLPGCHSPSRSMRFAPHQGHHPFRVCRRDTAARHAKCSSTVPGGLKEAEEPLPRSRLARLCGAESIKHLKQNSAGGSLLANPMVSSHWLPSTVRTPTSPPGVASSPPSVPTSKTAGHRATSRGGTNCAYICTSSLASRGGCGENSTGHAQAEAAVGSSRGGTNRTCHPIHETLCSSASRFAAYW
ncbi:hypothetical protein GALMADRAFT_148867 [Galerina marginata CBS 339.88]|uniref:Uncharacterized protein n=1 Tax=Galerina marginata (strain CBS 339.88) TaxID=685588 RepID=A0A067S323_GALM3|nr:hypothetical protein GALMADRAFT_148867 [Galerina marginata CBS 339.88]